MAYLWKISAFVLLVNVGLVQSGAVMKIWLIRYINDAGLDSNGQRCDLVGGCDHDLLLCLDQKRTVNSQLYRDHTRCDYYFELTGRLGAGSRNEFTDRKYIGNVENPIVHTFDAWPGEVLFKVYVEDDDSLNRDDHVDTLYKLLEYTPVAFANREYLAVQGMRGRRSQSPTSLEFRVMVYCAEAFYGPDCARFCESSDSRVSGHYTCNPRTGAKVCLPGWEGPECKQPTNDCAANSCLNGGTCLDLVHNYTCNCLPGFSGLKCNIVIDACDPSPCIHASRCSTHLGSSVCHCETGYVGDTCLYHICETETPCHNGGTCVGNGECLCAVGYTGPICETDLCDSITCENGGVCHKGACLCPSAYTGELCEYNSCRDIQCQNGGTCLQGTCVCPLGLTGAHCEGYINYCIDRPCENKGTCFYNETTYHCLCLPAYSGRNCSDMLPTPTEIPDRPVTTHQPRAFTSSTKTTPTPTTTTHPTGPPRTEPVVGAPAKGGNKWWIYVAIGVGGLLVLTIIVVAVLASKYRRKKSQLKAAEQSYERQDSFDNPAFQNSENVYENTAGMAYANVITPRPPAPDPTTFQKRPDINLNIVPDPNDKLNAQASKIRRSSTKGGLNYQPEAMERQLRYQEIRDAVKMQK